MDLTEALARLAPDSLKDHMNETTNAEVEPSPMGWRQLMEPRLKSKVMLWFSMTMNVSRLVLNKISEGIDCRECDDVCGRGEWKIPSSQLRKLCKCGVGLGTDCLTNGSCTCWR